MIAQPTRDILQRMASSGGGVNLSAVATAEVWTHIRDLEMQVKSLDFQISILKADNDNHRRLLSEM
jgi:hypothetical protein